MRCRTGRWPSSARSSSASSRARPPVPGPRSVRSWSASSASSSRGASARRRSGSAWRWSRSRCSAARRCSGRSTGSTRRRSGPRSTRHADARLVATLVDDPDAARFDARALVRVDRFDGRGGGHRRVLVDASGDVAGHLRLLAAGERVVLRGWFTPLEGFDERWRWKHAVGAFHATDVLGVAPTRSPLTRLANDARALVLAGSEHLGPTDRSLLAGFLLGDTRGVPEALTGAVPGRRPHPPDRGLGGERRVRARALRAAAPPARAARARARGAGVADRVRHHDPMGAVGAPGHRDGRARAGGRAPRPSRGGRAGARVGRDRAAARRPVPPAPGRVPVVVRGEPGHHAPGPPDHRAAARSRTGCARCSASPPPRRSGWRRCSSRCSAPCPWSRCPPTWSRSPSPRRSRCGASWPAWSAAWPGRCRPRSRACWSCRRSVCSTRSSRWPTSRRGCRSPSTVGRRGVWLLSVPSRRPDGATRRLRTHARVPVPPR